MELARAQLSGEYQFKACRGGEIGIVMVVNGLVKFNKLKSSSWEDFQPSYFVFAALWYVATGGPGLSSRMDTFFKIGRDMNGKNSVVWMGVNKWKMWWAKTEIEIQLPGGRSARFQWSRMFEHEVRYQS